MMTALASVFAITWLTSTAMAAYLPMLLQMQGLTAIAHWGGAAFWLTACLGLLPVVILQGMAASWQRWSKPQVRLFQAV